MNISKEELERRRVRLLETYCAVRCYVGLLKVPVKYRDDLIQEVYIVAYNNIDKLKDMSKLYSWLRKIAHRELARLYREEAEIRNSETLYTPEDWEKDEIGHSKDYFISDGSEEELIKKELVNIIKGLKPPVEEIIRLRFLEGYTLKEVAKMMNLNYNTVKSMETRAFQKIKEQIHR